MPAARKVIQFVAKIAIIAASVEQGQKFDGAQAGYNRGRAQRRASFRISCEVIHFVPFSRYDRLRGRPRVNTSLAASFRPFRPEGSNPSESAFEARACVAARLDIPSASHELGETTVVIAPLTGSAPRLGHNSIAN